MSMHKELKKKTGVYIIINKITRAYYIGSAITNKLYVRYSDHLLYFRGSKPLKESVLEYGLKSFIFGILEYNNNIITKKNRKVLWEIENKYLSLYQPIYNKYPQADSPKGYKHSEESIAKMKLNFTSERKEKYSKMLKVKNIILTSEVKLKLRNLALSRSKDYISEEGKLRQSLSKQVDVNLYLDDTLLCTIKGINKAAHLLCCSYSTIHRSIEKGYIYIPDSFIRYLTNDYINNNNDIISKINKDNKVSKVKYKSGNKD
ncbi:group I intron endonuclease [Chlamydia trachomatis]|jgi:group I intron endonuclease|nr:group I intron endonuclease [Chlamydia trachomatis]